MRTSKNLYIQELRCICIIAVIGIHAFTLQPESANSLYWGVTFRQFINFPVAFFFFLAGYFAKPAKLHVRIKKIFIPYFIWTSTYWIKPLIFHSGAISWGGGAPILYKRHRARISSLFFSRTLSTGVTYSSMLSHA